MYWNDRTAKAQNAISNKTRAQIEKQMVKYYQRSMEKLISEFEATYNHLLASIEAGREPTPADLYKLDKYWKLVGQTKAELQKLGDKQIHLLADSFYSEFVDVYNSFSLPSQVDYSTLSREGIEQMINQIWCADGKSWSQRVWKNTDLLAETLNEGLLHCVVSGAPSSNLRKVLRESFNATYSNADKIVRTELAHIQTQAAQKRYEDYGIEMVEVWADEDERRCEVCGELHKKRYPITAQMPIPAHPNCRCCIVPVVDGLFYQGLDGKETTK